MFNALLLLSSILATGCGLIYNGTHFVTGKQAANDSLSELPEPDNTSRPFHTYRFHNWPASVPYGNVRCAPVPLGQCLNYTIKGQVLYLHKACASDILRTNYSIYVKEYKPCMTRDSHPATDCRCHNWRVVCNGYVYPVGSVQSGSCLLTWQACTKEEGDPCRSGEESPRWHWPHLGQFWVYLLMGFIWLIFAWIVYHWGISRKGKSIKFKSGLLWPLFFLVLFFARRTNGVIMCPGTTAGGFTLEGCSAECTCTKVGYSFGDNPVIEPKAYKTCYGDCFVPGKAIYSRVNNHTGSWLTGCPLIHQGCDMCWLETDSPKYPAYQCICGTLDCTLTHSHGTIHHMVKQQKSTSMTVIPDLQCKGNVHMFGDGHLLPGMADITCERDYKKEHFSFTLHLPPACTEATQVSINGHKGSVMKGECRELDPKFPACQNGSQSPRYPCQATNGTICLTLGCEMKAGHETSLFADYKNKIGELAWPQSGGPFDWMKLVILMLSLAVLTLFIIILSR